MSKSVVHCARVRPGTVLLDYERLAHAAGLASHLDPLATTILREERSAPFPLPGANSPPWQLEGAAGALRGAGLEFLARAHGRPETFLAGDRRARRAHRLLTERHGLRPLGTADADARWVEYRPRAELRVLHTLFPEGVHVPNSFFGTNVVHLPPARPARSGATTGALGSALFGLLGPHAARAARTSPHAFVDALALERELHVGRFAFADATTVIPERDGLLLEHLEPSLVLASADSVALDATIARLFGTDPLRIAHLTLAQDAGFGIADPRDIELVGDVPEGPPWGAVGSAEEPPLRERLLARARTQLGHAGAPSLLRAASIAAEELYLERAFGPSRGEALFERWRTSSPWGRLDDAYVDGEHERITGRPSVRPVLG